MKDDPRSGRLCTNRTDENGNEQVREKVQTNRSLTVRMIADELGMKSERVSRIIMEVLGMKKIFAKMVPRLPNKGQRSGAWASVSRHLFWSNFKINPNC